MKSLILVCSVALALTACKAGVDDEGNNVGFSDGNAQGKVHAKDFTVRAGRTLTYLNGSQWTIDLYDEEMGNPCLLTTLPEYFLTTSIPQEEGDYPLSSTRTVSFSKRVSSGTQINVATRGALKIERIENGFVVGRIAAVFDDNNQINGEFTVKICD